MDLEEKVIRALKEPPSSRGCEYPILKENIRGMVKGGRKPRKTSSRKKNSRKCPSS